MTLIVLWQFATSRALWADAIDPPTASDSSDFWIVEFTHEGRLVEYSFSWLLVVIGFSISWMWLLKALGVEPPRVIEMPFTPYSTLSTQQESGFEIMSKALKHDKVGEGALLRRSSGLALLVVIVLHAFMAILLMAGAGAVGMLFIGLTILIALVILTRPSIGLVVAGLLRFGARRG